MVNTILSNIGLTKHKVGHLFLIWQAQLQSEMIQLLVLLLTI